MKTATTLFAVLLVSTALSGDAQQLSTATSGVFEPGTRVRVRAAESKQRIVGTVVHASRDSVVVDTADAFRERRFLNPAPILVDDFRRVTLPVANVDSVEVSLGRSRALGVIKGSLAGAIFGGLYVGLSGLSGYGAPSFRRFSRGFTQGAPAGAVVGVPIGWVFRGERWMRVSVPRPRGVPGLLPTAESRSMRGEPRTTAP